eukprot:265543-Prorocentrum_minimum.AAC.4
MPTAPGRLQRRRSRSLNGEGRIRRSSFRPTVQSARLRADGHSLAFCAAPQLLLPAPLLEPRPESPALTTSGPLNYLLRSLQMFIIVLRHRKGSLGC